MFTMNRIVAKYDRFLTIMASHLGHMVVPTLDVALAWHTHQHSPSHYYECTVNLTKKFIDHDDKIDENKLSDGFEWTSRKYEKAFGKVYPECVCWYCEAVREKKAPTLPFIGGNRPIYFTRLSRPIHSTVTMIPTRILTYKLTTPFVSTQSAQLTRKKDRSVLKTS